MIESTCISFYNSNVIVKSFINICNSELEHFLRVNCNKLEKKIEEELENGILH